jgi:hypothetical protein
MKKISLPKIKIADDQQNGIITLLHIGLIYPHIFLSLDIVRKIKIKYNGSIQIRSFLKI